MIRNYFADLELHFSADADEVRQAYRRLARRFHPDLNPEGLYAEESFKKIHEAYRYLADETRADRLRRRLRSELGVRGDTQAWPQSTIVPTTLQHFVTDWKEEKTSKTSTRTQTKTRSKTKSLRRENLQAEFTLHVSARNIFDGFEKNISFVVEKPCSQCRLPSKKSQWIAETCKHCAGMGFLSIQRGAYVWKKSCVECRGEGFVRRTRCVLCQGRAKMMSREEGRVIWKGSRQLVRTIVLKNWGHYSFDGKQRGDLWLHLEVD